MKQTAVEWLHEKLAKSTQEELVGNINTYFKQAKELEKQHIIDACYFAYNEGCSYMSDGKTEFESFEQYYDETFTKQTRIANDNINVTNK